MSCRKIEKTALALKRMRTIILIEGEREREGGGVEMRRKKSNYTVESAIRATAATSMGASTKQKTCKTY